MSKLLFRLRHVPDDEADDVRKLLEEESIRYYETQAGLFGLSAGAIWLNEASDYPHAKQLLDQYQAQRRERAKREYEAAQRDGTAETFQSMLRERPLHVVLLLCCMLMAIGLVFIPYLLLR